MTGQPLAYVIGRMWDGGNISHYAPEHPRVLIDGSPARAPWIDLGDLRARGAAVVWTDGDPGRLPAAYRAIAEDAELQPPFTLPFRLGTQTLTVGWALLRPRPVVAGALRRLFGGANRSGSHRRPMPPRGRARSVATSGSFSQASRPSGGREHFALPRQRLRVKRNRLAGVQKRLVHRVAGRETAGQIRKPQADGLIRSRVLNDGDVMRHRLISSPLTWGRRICRTPATQVVFGTAAEPPSPW